MEFYIESSCIFYEHDKTIIFILYFIVSLLKTIIYLTVVALNIILCLWNLKFYFFVFDIDSSKMSITKFICNVTGRLSSHQCAVVENEWLWLWMM